MVRKSLSLLFGCLLVLTVSAAHGEVLISVDANGGTVAQTGTAGTGKIIDFYLSQTSGSSDLFAGNFGNFDFTAGTITNVTTGATGVGVNNGFLGEGNLSLSDAPVDVGGASFTFNQEYTDLMQSIPVRPSNPALWMRLELDTTGLADGDYAITLREDQNGNFLNQSAIIVDSNNSLFFSVGQAVPEPSSLALLGAFSLISALRRKRA